jgi:hypothetical protein
MVGFGSNRFGFQMLMLTTLGWAALVLDADEAKVGCAGGTCPSPSETASADGKPQDGCGLWLGPSPIKKEEEHGFGLGMFTGKAIPKGTTVESIYGDGEILLPLYGYISIYDDHSPLREYVWEESRMPEIAVEYPHGVTASFIPGLAAIAPCTSLNYNLEMVGTGKVHTTRDSVLADSGYVHRSTHVMAGSFTYRHNVTYVAVRDIAPGEELTVNCEDDSFDGGAYFLSRFNSNDDAVVCLDNNLRVDTATNPGLGRGLFAKQTLSKDSVVISSPMIPIRRKEMDIDDEEVNMKQLMLNYCYGHPDSDLLLLPYGPLVNYLNHSPEPNAVIRWHLTDENKPELDRRQQHHHPELLSMSGEEVAVTHGMGLMMDIVALREIHADEEIVLDYGANWNKAWEDHVAWYKFDRDMSYSSAPDYIRATGGETTVVRTEKEQRVQPYPSTVETYCFYKVHPNHSEKNHIEFSSWDDDDNEARECFRPCLILERYQASGGSLGSTASSSAVEYTVKLVPTDNKRIIESCLIHRTYVVSNMPHNAIKLVDSPYTTDTFQKKAFRHELGVPSTGFYPDGWMKKKALRGKQTKPATVGGDKFKRKSNESPDQRLEV